jgi:hypothetical protein
MLRVDGIKQLVADWGASGGNVSLRPEISGPEKQLSRPRLACRCSHGADHTPKRAMPADPMSYTGHMGSFEALGCIFSMWTPM